MAKGSGQTQESETKISEQIAGPSGDIITALMGQAAVNPWDLEYTGPRVAAANQAQKDVMDGTAAAGNAFNMGFTSAAGGLPEETTMNGMQVYDVLGMAKDGISPEMQTLLDQMYGDSGPFAKYRFGNKGSGGGGGRGRGLGNGGYFNPHTDPRVTGRDRQGNTVSGGGIDMAYRDWQRNPW